MRAASAGPGRRWLLRLLAALPCAAALAQGAPAPADGAVVNIAIAGDVMLADGPGRFIRAGGDPFAPTARWWRQADIRIANLECVVATTGSAEPDKPYTFRAHPRTLRVLGRHLDAVSLANNHSGDFGPQAFGQMLGLLEQRKIGYFGGGRTLAEAHRPLIIERRGLRIAFLGYNEFFPRSFEADIDKPGVAWSEDEQVEFDIRRARSRYGADLVIPFMHWGWEHDTEASQRQRQLARRMIDAGADAVVGGHPHVIQDVEQYKGRPIVYSLGNFVFDGFDKPVTTTGWLLQLQVDRSGARAWQAYTVRMDARGTPHPQGQAPAACWKRGTSAGASSSPEDCSPVR